MRRHDKKHNGLIERVRQQTPADGGVLTERASETLHRIAEQAAAAAIEGKGRAKGARSTLSVVAKDRGPQLAQVSHRVSEDAVPAVRDVAVRAASVALELWQEARERAEEAGKSARKDLGPQATGIVGSAEKRAGEATHAVTRRAEEAVTRTRAASRQAAQTTVDTGKDTGALLFWAGAATGVILFLLMSKDRRDQVLRMAESSIGQIREVVRDFQGYDEEFTANA